MRKKLTMMEFFLLGGLNCTLTEAGQRCRRGRSAGFPAVFAFGKLCAESVT